MNSISKDIAAVKERIHSLQQEITYIEHNKNQKKEECRLIEINNEQGQEAITDKKNKIHISKNEIEQLKRIINDCLEYKEKNEEKISLLQENLKKKREELSVLQQEYHRTENKKIRIEMELDKNINKLWEDYEETYSSALAYKKDIGAISKAQKQINALKNAIRELGNINVNAIEEYKSVKERYEFLSAQKDDLEHAERGLVKVINEMYELMKKQFAEQFKIINEAFNGVFNQLFGGGKANLKFSDPENILECDIEIEAQPPGKKLQNIMLLSGGEKALTAIAILFAILKVRPTPFCILDEIEAALDDVNVYKFADYLSNYSEETQFIIVTHRRGTMEAANVLYGVTMQEKGVSKLISLKMDDVAS